MEMQISGWDDGYNAIRIQIIKDVMNIMHSVFKNDALYENNLIICNSYSVNCEFADDKPCTHFDRSRICISSTGDLPQPIKWFDEFICCCSSYLVEKYISISTNGKYDYMFGNNTAETFREYLEIKQSGHIYQVNDCKDFFKINRTQYETDQNLIKNHDVFVYKFFRRIGQNWSGLSFVGKMWKVNLDGCYSIEEYLSRLSTISTSEENKILNVIKEIFGL